MLNKNIQHHNFLKYEQSALVSKVNRYTILVFTLGQPLSQRFLFAFLSRHFILAAKIKPIKVKTDVFDSAKRYHEWLSLFISYTKWRHLFASKTYLEIGKKFWFCHVSLRKIEYDLKNVDLSFQKGPVITLRFNQTG